MEENTTQTSSGNNSQLVKYGSILALVAVAAIAGFVFLSSRSGQSANTAVPTPTSALTSPAPTVAAVISPTASAPMAAYKDGEYTAIGKYTSPGGAEEIGVTLTVESGVITDAAVEPKATRPISAKLQQDFAANYKTLVVGKKLADLNLGKVSGASLTPQGFNDALKAIRAEAQI